MFWVVQEDLFIENRRWDLVAALERLGIAYQLVRLGAAGLEPAVERDGAIITNGSVMLSKIAVQRGWRPGSLLNNNFSYEVWHPIFRPWLLNREAVFTTLAEAAPMSDAVFVRPVLDDKSFTGRVMTLAELRALQADSRAGRRGAPRPDTGVLVAPPKRIGQEHRHYIVDGEVVTSSRYKLGGAVNHAEGADPAVVDFARRMAALWQPARAFVLDTYVAGDEIGVVEMGCIGNAGLYQADVQRLVGALDAMPVD